MHVMGDTVPGQWDFALHFSVGSRLDVLAVVMAFYRRVVQFAA